MYIIIQSRSDRSGNPWLIFSQTDLWIISLHSLFYHCIYNTSGKWYVILALLQKVKFDTKDYQSENFVMKIRRDLILPVVQVYEWKLGLKTQCSTLLPVMSWAGW